MKRTEFTPHHYADWRASVEKALGGAPIDKLVTKSPSGLARAPLYQETDYPSAEAINGLPGQYPFTRGTHGTRDTHNAWRIGARVTPGRKGYDNASILADLEGGVSALIVDFSYADELPALPHLLKGVMANILPLYLAGAHYGLDAAAALSAYWQEALGDATQAQGGFNYDPLGTMVAHKHDYEMEALPRLIALGALHEHVDLMTASGIAYHNAGADDVQELGFALAAYIDYMRALTMAGLDVAHAFAKTTMTLSAGTDFFMNIAKCRAARRLMARAAKAAHVSYAPRLYMETSEAQLSLADIWVNILRATIGACAAALGGADMIVVAPCSTLSEGDNELTRRIARNTQLILQEESHIGHVIDPAGGSWYIDALSDHMARQAWALFQDIERQGGMGKAISSGFVADILSTTRTHMRDKVNKREAPLLGVSAFPNLDEALLTPRRNVYKGREGMHRPAQPFETLRFAAQSVKPKVFLATIGTQAEFSLRANFAAALYAVGGIDALMGEGGEDVAAIADAFRKSGAKIAAICSTDALYEDYARPLAHALSGAGATHIALAGTFTTLQVDDLIFTGCDAYGFLQKMHGILGLTE